MVNEAPEGRPEVYPPINASVVELGGEVFYKEVAEEPACGNGIQHMSGGGHGDSEGVHAPKGPSTS